jgi:hypothetical protein
MNMIHSLPWCECSWICECGVRYLFRTYWWECCSSIVLVDYIRSVRRELGRNPFIVVSEGVILFRPICPI